MSTLYRPELLYFKGGFVPNAGILVGDGGEVQAITASADGSAAGIVDLPGKAILPGFVNAHSHSFQRLIRGKSESRVESGKDFWSWRNTMYHAAASLSPQDVYDVARMAFLEMVLAGTTTVGEFHYVHTAPDGRPYDDPNLLSKQVIAAAQSVGIRIVLLRTAYLRSGFELPSDPGQVRFFESTREFVANTEALLDAYSAAPPSVGFGVAPHSIRAVPLGDLKEIVALARQKRLPIHMHVAEQVAENIACSREYGCTPVALLGREKLLGPDFTAVHAIHTYPEEVRMLSDAAATICSCPTTERNLGDGVIAADQDMKEGVRIALGSDSQAQIDPLEDARELEYHSRLQYEQRAILDQIGGRPLAARLFECATVNGARALALPAGELSPGSVADFFTVDLDDLSIAGHSPEDLLPMLVFSLNRLAIRDVAVNGNLILRDGQHVQRGEIVSRYQELRGKVWSSKNPAGAHR
jgi:formimidoylglutamate deiminase